VRLSAFFCAVIPVLATSTAALRVAAACVSSFACLCVPVHMCVLDPCTGLRLPSSRAALHCCAAIRVTCSERDEGSAAGQRKWACLRVRPPSRPLLSLPPYSCSPAGRVVWCLTFSAALRQIRTRRDCWTEAACKCTTASCKIGFSNRGDVLLVVAPTDLDCTRLTKRSHSCALRSNLKSSATLTSSVNRI
jgi:hypothetical protein